MKRWDVRLVNLLLWIWAAAISSHKQKAGNTVAYWGAWCIAVVFGAMFISSFLPDEPKIGGGTV